MNNSGMDNAGDRIIRWGVPLLGAAIALSVSLISLTPLTIKSTLLQAGVALLFAAWVVKTAGRERFHLGKPLSRLVIPAFAFMLSAVFSFLFITGSKDTSLDELMLRVPYFLLFFIGAVSFSDVSRMRQTLVAIMAISFVVSAYGIFQHFGLDPLRMGDRFRIPSTFGNANFYVGFLTLVIPVVAASFNLADDAERKKAFSAGVPIVVFSIGYYVLTVFNHALLLNGIVFSVLAAGIVALCFRFRLAEKSFAAFTLFLLINNIFMTGSRSGQIGLGVALILFSLAVFFFVMPYTSPKKIFLITVASLFAAALVTAGVLHISYSDEGRLKTVSERKYYVDGALNLIGQKPLFGFGIGTFKNNYPVIKKPESWAYNATCFEHVSNVYNEHLEIFHDEGLVGFALWIWLLAMVFFASFRAVRAWGRAGGTSPPASDVLSGPSWQRWYSPSPQVMLIGLASGTAALLVGNIFSLSMRYASTGFYFWLFLGFMAALASGAPGGGGEAAPALAPTGKKGGIPGRPVLLLDALVVLVALAVSLFAVRFYLADVYLNTAVNYSKDAYTPVDTEGEVFHDIFIEGTRYRSDSLTWEKALFYYHKSLSNNPYNLRARYFCGNAFNRRWNLASACNPAWGDRPGVPRTDLERAMEQYEYINRQARHYTEIDFELGDLYMKLGNIDKAIAAYKDYKRYKPFFTKIHYTLANAFVANKDWANAAESYKDALDLNQKFTIGYLELSAVYQKMGKEDLAAEMFERAKEVSPAKAHLAMADVWERFGEKERALESLHLRIAEDSADARPYARLGWIAIENKQWEQAIAWYEKVVRFNPKYAPAWVNLSNLYYENGRIDEAKTAFEKALALDPLYVRSLMRAQGR
jgi:O-antigen ligase